jgi:hypothetical protein
MKNLQSIGMAAVLLVMCASPAMAVDTTRVYNSGILVLIFLGVCALIVGVQLIPALVLCFGSIRTMLRGKGKTAVARGRA